MSNDYIFYTLLFILLAISTWTLRKAYIERHNIFNKTKSPEKRSLMLYSYYFGWSFGLPSGLIMDLEIFYWLILIVFLSITFYFIFRFYLALQELFI